MSKIRREYLDLNLGDIGTPLPTEKFRFDSQNTFDQIIAKIESDILGPMAKKKNDEVQKQKKALEDKIKEVSTNGEKTGDKFDSSLYAVCKKIPFDDYYDTKKIVQNREELKNLHGKVPYQVFNLMPNYKSSKEHQKHVQYVIGRVASINDFGGYNMRAFRILLLEGKSFTWTPIVNDLFITCSLAFGKILNNEDKLVDKSTLFFPIMLVMDKGCLVDKDNQDVPHAFTVPTMDEKTYKELYKDLTAQNANAKGTCVFPNSEALTYPSVTFRELVILADIIGMNIYKLKTPEGFDLVTDNHYIYYFSFKNDNHLSEKIKTFNNANKGTDFNIIPVEIKWARKDSPFKSKSQSGGKYYEKYIKYKTKYMLLKKLNI